MIPLFAPKSHNPAGTVTTFQDRNFEKQLVAALKKRDTGCIALLHESYSPALYGIIRRIVQDDSGAEKVLQATMDLTCQTIGQYDPDKLKFFTWMVSTARRIAAQELDQQIRDEKEKEKQAHQQAVTVKLKVVHAAGATHDNNGMRKLADTIEPKYRMILNLIYFQGFSVEEISTRFSLPVQEVKLRLAIAIRQLRSGCTHE